MVLFLVGEFLCRDKQFLQKQTRECNYILDSQFIHGQSRAQDSGGLVLICLQRYAREQENGTGSPMTLLRISSVIHGTSWQKSSPLNS